MKESSLQNVLRMFMSGLGIMNWRNNTGTGWVGKAKRYSSPATVRVDAGDVVIRNARPLHSGLCKGSSDIIGITEVFVTEAHVGRKLGVFTAVEVKTQTGRPTKDQLNFLQQVEAKGGYAGIARNRDDILDIVVRD